MSAKTFPLLRVVVFFLSFRTAARPLLFKRLAGNVHYMHYAKSGNICRREALALSRSSTPVLVVVSLPRAVLTLMWRCGAAFQLASEEQAGSPHHNDRYSNLKIALIAEKQHQSNLMAKA
jgi:hypothetical protein